MVHISQMELLKLQIKEMVLCMFLEEPIAIETAIKYKFTYTCKN